jgi:NAD-dependent oxidoreductase involved in siderophore biosynthesis
MAKADKPSAKKPPTHPDFRLDVMRRICERISRGELAAAAAHAEGISAPTVWRWTAEDETARTMYAHAKHQAADALAEEAIRIALETTNETYSADRLKVDTLKWAAAKRRPKEYGERQAVETSGEQTLNVVIRSE